MKRYSFALLTLAAGMILAAPSAHAQAPAGASAVPPAPRPGPPPVKSTIDFATAQKVAVAARTAAAAADANVAIAIVDSNGDLVYFERMDGSGAVAASQGKARAAMLFGLPTKQVADAMAAGKPLPVTVTKPPQGAQEFMVLQGGLPILKDGKVVAAIGVGGSSSPNDEKFAQAGIDALGK